MWGKRIMPPGYDGLEQDNPYKAPQNQAQPPQNSALNPQPDPRFQNIGNAPQNLTGNGSQSSGSGMSAADWAALMALAQEYFGKDKKTRFRNVPLSPQQEELWRRSVGYLDNSPTRNYLMPQVDQRLRALGASSFNMPATIGARGLPEGIAGQTFYQPTANRNAPGGGTPPLGPLVTSPDNPAPPIIPPREPGDRPDRPKPPGERPDSGGPGMELKSFFDSLRPEDFAQFEGLAPSDQVAQAGGFKAWWSAQISRLADYITRNPSDVSGFVALVSSVFGGPLGGVLAKLLSPLLIRWARSARQQGNGPQGSGGGQGRGAGGGNQPGDGGGYSGPGSGEGPGADQPSQPGSGTTPEGSFDYYTTDPVTGKKIKL